MTCLAIPATGTSCSKARTLRGGEEGHQSPKYFRRLGDLGLSDPLRWGAGPYGTGSAPEPAGKGLCGASRAARWDRRHGRGLAVHGEAAGGCESPSLPVCDGCARAHLRDMGPAGADVGHERFVGRLSQTALEGQANHGRCNRALLPTARSGCNDFLAAKLNCLGKLSAVTKEK